MRLCLIRFILRLTRIFIQKFCILQIIYYILMYIEKISFNKPVNFSYLALLYMQQIIAQIFATLFYSKYGKIIYRF